MRETINGVLHVIHVPKQPKGSWFQQLVTQELQRAGRVKTEYWPPRYFLLSEDVVRDRRPDDAAHQAWRAGSSYQFSFKGRPRHFSPELRGHRVEVRATVQPWSNHLGGYLDRPQILKVGEYVECPYHSDPYGNPTDPPTSGSSRIFCKQWR